MEHLVRLHDAGVYRIESGNAVEITEPCEECGKRDDICLSWEEGKREEVLGRFLTGKDKKTPTKIGIHEIYDTRGNRDLIGDNGSTCSLSQIVSPIEISAHPAIVTISP